MQKKIIVRDQEMGVTDDGRVCLDTLWLNLGYKQKCGPITTAKLFPSVDEHRHVTLQDVFDLPKKTSGKAARGVYLLAAERAMFQMNL